MRAHRAGLVLLLAACGGGGSSPTVDAGDVTDATAAVDVAAAPDTWTSYAKGFIDTYCVRCHMQGGSGFRSGQLDWTSYDLVKANAVEIRCGTAATRPATCASFPPLEQFPIAAPFPSDAERDRFGDWLAAGAPQ